MVEEPSPAITIPEKAVLVQPEAPRGDSDVIDDRIKMGGAVGIALLIIAILAWLSLRGDSDTAVVGAFVLALDRVIRYFFNTGNGQ